MKTMDQGEGRAIGLNRAVAVAAMFALAAAAGCGGGDDGPVTPEPPRAEAISISPASVTLTMIGETATFTANITDQNGAPFSATVTWSSNAPQVFTVDGNGTVTAVGNGSGTVAATLGNLSATASVTVNEPPRAVELSIMPESVTLTEAGETAEFSASLTDQFGEPFMGTVTWSSDAADVFTVDGNGVVTAVANGSGMVTAAHESLSASAAVTVEITPNQAPTARGNPDDIAVAVGGGAWPFLPAAYFDDPDADNLDLTYTSELSNPVASAEVNVDSEGHVSIIIAGTAAGNATLTVTATDAGGLSARHTLAVTVDDSGFTPLPPLRIADNRLELGGFSIVGSCTPPLVNVPFFAGGPVFTVNSSKWQTRSDAESAWADVEGTEMTTGAVCPYTSEIPGEYRLVMNATIVIDEHQAPITGAYRSGNSFVVEDDSGMNAAPAVSDDAPRDFRLSVGGGPYFLTPAVFIHDPNGDALTFTAAVSDAAVLSVEVIVDTVGHTLMVATGTGVGSGTLTITATDPGGLTAELAMEVSVDDTGYTPYHTIAVANGVIRSQGLSFSECLPPIINTPGIDGNIYTVHSSKWQRRDGASAAWADIEGTEITDGRICPYSTNELGDYRVVYEITVVVEPHLPGYRGKYASSNYFTVSANQAP